MENIKTNKKLLLSIALVLGVSGCTLIAINSGTLYDRLKGFVSRQGVIVKKHDIEYLLHERGSTSLAKEYNINGKKLITYQRIFPHSYQDKDGFAQPILSLPFWYRYDGRDYRDPKMDGLNGNEELAVPGPSQKISFID